jgi:hypothetical protein
MKMISRLLADALDSTTHISSPLMGEDKGEGDNWSGRARAPGLLERASPLSLRAKRSNLFPP